MEGLTDEDVLEMWNERAAIREYDAHTWRGRAEYLAARDVRQMLGFMPEIAAEKARESVNQ